MIHLRELQQTDAPLMLEWMHDPEIQKSFRKKLQKATIDDAIEFIADATFPNEIINGSSLHYAIADEKNEYLGTVSLKDIDLYNKTAEYAITTRKKAHGKGIAFCATGLVLDKAFRELCLHRVFLTVLSTNMAAIGLYEKSGFVFEGELRDHFIIDRKYVSWKLYGMLEEEYDKDIFCNDEGVI